MVSACKQILMMDDSGAKVLTVDMCCWICRWWENGAAYYFTVGSVFPGTAFQPYRQTDACPRMHQHSHWKHPHPHRALPYQGEDIQGKAQSGCWKSQQHCFKMFSRLKPLNRTWVTLFSMPCSLESMQVTSVKLLAGWMKPRLWTPLTASSTPSVPSICWRLDLSKRLKRCVPSSHGLVLWRSHACENALKITPGVTSIKQFKWSEECSNFIQ